MVLATGPVTWTVTASKYQPSSYLEVEPRVEQVVEQVACALHHLIVRSEEGHLGAGQAGRREGCSTWVTEWVPPSLLR